MRKQSAIFRTWNCLQKKWPSFSNWSKAGAVDFIVAQLFIPSSCKRKDYSFVIGSYICAYCILDGHSPSGTVYTPVPLIQVGLHDFASWWVSETGPHLRKLCRQSCHWLCYPFMSVARTSWHKLLGPSIQRHVERSWTTAKLQTMCNRSQKLKLLLTFFNS